MKVLKFCCEYILEIILCLVISVLVFIIIFGIVKSIQHENWYNSLSAEEQMAYDIKVQEKQEANIHRYEVVSVYKYVKNQTNGFGGIIDTDICYNFQYLNNGELHSIDDFEDTKYGLTKVIIGDKDMYVVDTNGVDDYRYLQLTKETLSKLTTH